MYKRIKLSMKNLLRFGPLRLLLTVVLAMTAIVAIRAFAHGGEDHGAATGTASSGATAVTAEGNAVIQIPKESQFTFELLTEPVIERTLEASRGVTGVVVPRPGARAEVFPPQEGRIAMNRTIKIGDRVSKGELLFSVEQVLSGTERLGLERDLIAAKSELDEAQRDYTRKQALEGIVAKKEIELAGIRLRSARERRSALEQALTRGTTPVKVFAPISGTVTMADLVAGEFVEVRKQLLEITNLSSVWVEAAIYQTDLRDLPPMPTAIITFPSAEGSFVGQLVSEGKTLSPDSKSATLHFSVHNPNDQLKIGATADVLLNLGAPKQVLAVAKSAIVTNGSFQYVFVHTGPEEFVAKQFVAGSSQNGEYVEVQSGLELNDRAVVRNASVLRGKIQ